MAANVAYVKLAIEGIQKYICSTGKLKEMIGGSEIINFIASADFYGEILARQGLEEDGDLEAGPGKYVVAQANAGALCLILPTSESARDFLNAASEKILACFPGLPFYGAISEFSWADDAQGKEAYMQARKSADGLVTCQRNQAPVPQGSGLLPVLRASRLDGLPAVERDDELVSLPSRARRNPDMIARSRARLHADVHAPEGMILEWKEDLKELLGTEEGKVALICMDGNDLGKLFGKRLAESAPSSLREFIRHMKGLSNRLQACNNRAFNHACERIAQYEAVHGKKMGDTVVMPLRPLVMGGDDITIIARADIALPFVEMFTAEFDRLGKADHFSIGIGMVVMDSSYPFAKAFPLAESLQDSAKNLTCHLEPGERPSSIDYLVLTEEVENNIELVRQRLFTCPGGEILTGKPFVLKDGKFLRFLEYGDAVLSSLPRGQIREAWTRCRLGPQAVKAAWRNLRENISRGLGGRAGQPMQSAKYKEIFPDNFFVRQPENGLQYTSLGDYLELERLLPKDEKARQALLNVLKKPANKESRDVQG